VGLSMAEKGVRPEESRGAKAKRSLFATARRFRPVAVASGRIPMKMNTCVGIRDLDRVDPRHAYRRERMFDLFKIDSREG
jgi:hypothetical protein